MVGGIKRKKGAPLTGNVPVKTSFIGTFRIPYPSLESFFMFTQEKCVDYLST